MGGCGGGGGGMVVRRGGGLRATHYYHMHTSRGDVGLGAWGFGGMYVIMALSGLCQEESLKGRVPPPPTNDICIARRLANPALRTWRV